jgi:hypothetical protein
MSGIVLASTGVALLVLFALNGSEVDDLGILREPFYLLGIGAPITLLGSVIVLGVLGARMTKTILEKR